MNTCSERWKIHEVDVSDLEFERVPMLVQRRDGSTSKAWVPVGMPKIDQRLLQASFFLYRENPKHPDGYDGPWGTGCVVARPATHPNEPHHYYAVSNRHVVHRNRASTIRINTKDGKARYIDKSPDVDWVFVGDKDDLAIADISDDLNVATDAVSCIPESGFATERFIERFEIAVGDDLFMLGLFADQHGGDINVPSGRFGNLSLLASKDAPIENDYGNRRPSHIGDMRSRAGYSGSPVFCYRNFGSDLAGAARGQVKLDPTLHFLKFLGVHCGQFPDTITFEKAKKAEAIDPERLGEPIAEGDKIKIQSALTIIVPAWEVSVLLNHSVLQAARKQREKGGSGQWARIPHAEMTDRV